MCNVLNVLLNVIAKNLTLHCAIVECLIHLFSAIPALLSHHALSNITF